MNTVQGLKQVKVNVFIQKKLVRLISTKACIHPSWPLRHQVTWPKYTINQNNLCIGTILTRRARKPEHVQCMVKLLEWAEPMHIGERVPHVHLCGSWLEYHTDFPYMHS